MEHIPNQPSTAHTHEEMKEDDRLSESDAIQEGLSVKKPINGYPPEWMDYL